MNQEEMQIEMLKSCTAEHIVCAMCHKFQEQFGIKPAAIMISDNLLANFDLTTLCVGTLGVFYKRPEDDGLPEYVMFLDENFCIIGGL